MPYLCDMLEVHKNFSVQDGMDLLILLIYIQTYSIDSTLLSPSGGLRMWETLQHWHFLSQQPFP